MTRGQIYTLLPALLLFLARPGEAQVDPLAALAEGNLAAQAGNLEAAIAAYQRGYQPGAAHPTLAYNLGTTLHQLGRLPEAILWYRRAAPADPAADPWLADNLLLARRDLGSQNAGHPGVWTDLRRHSGTLTTAAVLLSWAGAAAFLLAPRRRIAAFGALAAAGVLFAAAWLSFELAAREAVLLSDCQTGAGALPAGSELWVVEDGGRWRVAGSRDASCPADVLALIQP